MIKFFKEAFHVILGKVPASEFISVYYTVLISWSVRIGLAASLILGVLIAVRGILESFSRFGSGWDLILGIIGGFLFALIGMVITVTSAGLISVLLNIRENVAVQNNQIEK